MKNQKEISPADEQMDKDFLETISAINNGLEKLDSIDSYTPDINWFEQMVLNQQEIQKKKYLKEFGWFFFSALLILSAVLFTLLELPQLFFILQAAAVAVTVFFSYKGVQKQVDGR
jgi:hypothetical protein